MNLFQINRIRESAGLPPLSENPGKAAMKKRQRANRAEHAEKCREIKTARTGKFNKKG